MNPIGFAKRRPVTTLVLLAALVGGVLFGISKVRPDVVPPLNEKKLHVYMEFVRSNAMRAKEYAVAKYEAHFHKEAAEEHHEAPHRVVATSPQAKDVTITQQYVCQIRSQRHIEIRALDNGYLEEILVREGQAVKKGDTLFKILPVLYQAKLDAEMAEAHLAELEYNNAKRLSDDKVVSPMEVQLVQARLAKAKAKAQLAAAELNFTNVRAPFDGIVDRLQEMLGSLIKEGDILTTLSDNTSMWVYFNVPESRYLEYMADPNLDDRKIELMLANGTKFNQAGQIGAIEAKFNNETGNIPFRADFPNPQRLLRHGQTGTVLIHRVLHNAMVIPQRASFETLDKRYVYVIDKDNVVHQKEIAIQNEMDDVFVIKDDLAVSDKIVLEGVRQVHDGQHVEYEFSRPEEVIVHLKNRAE